MARDFENDRIIKSKGWWDWRPSKTALGRRRRQKNFARHVVRRSLKRLGIAYIKEIAWSAHHLKNNCLREEIKRMAEEGDICQVEVDGLKGLLYMLPGIEKR